MVPRKLVQVFHPPQKFERPQYSNLLTHGFKNYDVEVTFNGMNSLMNYIKIHLVQKLLGGTHSQDGDVISLHSPLGKQAKKIASQGRLENLKYS
jgi:hypothetical protein